MLDALSFLFSISIIGIISLVKIGFWLFIIEYNKKTIVSRKHSYLIWNVYIYRSIIFSKTTDIPFLSKRSNYEKHWTFKSSIRMECNVSAQKLGNIIKQFRFKIST